MVCGNCGGGMPAGASTCGGCGFSACGGCGTMMAPNMTTCGSCGWAFGARRRNQETIVDDAAQYEASKRTLQSLEDHGEGDSAMADVAQAGMRAAQTKLIVGIVGGVVVLIIFLIILSRMHSSSSLGTAHVTGLLSLAREPAVSARLLLAGR